VTLLNMEIYCVVMSVLAIVWEQCCYKSRVGIQEDAMK